MNAITKRKTTNLVMNIGRSWALIFLLIELVFFSFFAQGFISLRVFQMIFFFGITVFLLGTAELFVIITGGIDLSVGYVMGFASIISAKMISAFIKAGMQPLPALILGIVLTLIIGDPPSAL